MSRGIECSVYLERGRKGIISRIREYSPIRYRNKGAYKEKNHKMRKNARGSSEDGGYNYQEHLKGGF